MGRRTRELATRDAEMRVGGGAARAEVVEVSADLYLLFLVCARPALLSWQE
jgi:hypothetical protein